MDEVDLEALAAAYDHRPPTAGSLLRAAAAAGAAGLGPGSTAVDVGGGRGWHAARFAAMGARALVVDRSEAMAAAASQHPGVLAVVGDAESLPVADGTADLVYHHLSIHYSDWRSSMREAARVCRPGGMVWVWTLRSEHHRTSFLARWFPSVGDIDEGRFPDPGGLAAHLAGSGWEQVRARDAAEEVERTAGEWRAAAAGGFVSTLQMLPAGEMEEGLRRFDAAHPDPAEVLRYSLLFCAVSARRPSLR